MAFIRWSYGWVAERNMMKFWPPELTSQLLAMDVTVLDVDQVENLIKFCPTKEEMELLKSYTGDKESLEKCEQVCIFSLTIFSQFFKLLDLGFYIAGLIDGSFPLTC
ncbi:hypothetical protein GOBAR_AA31626 [Gossypium barbadense]|uniref:FH2 domain-containing protein n=1 Tax=Gossypium barbadense TaxID=3634 RepID=A0A2P5WDC2_GOSBA|nr:hypothetical protein GOBAR_AA31626 [Gossypium barbadense]